MTAKKNDLLSQLESLVKGATEFRAKHGTCEVIVGPNAPVALAGIEKVGGFWINVDKVTLVSSKGEDDIVIDGPLVYYRAAEHGDLTAADVVRSIDWLMGSDIDFNTANWGSAETTGAVYLEGRHNGKLVDATFVLREFLVSEDWDEGWDDEGWDDDE